MTSTVATSVVATYSLKALRAAYNALINDGRIGAIPQEDVRIHLLEHVAIAVTTQHHLALILPEAVVGEQREELHMSLADLARVVTSTRSRASATVLPFGYDPENKLLTALLE